MPVPVMFISSCGMVSNIDMAESACVPSPLRAPSGAVRADVSEGPAAPRVASPDAPGAASAELWPWSERSITIGRHCRVMESRPRRYQNCIVSFSCSLNDGRMAG